MPVLTKFQKDYKNARFEAAFPQIVNFIDGQFRTDAEKSGRALAGLSMGGFNTLFISATFPNLFDYVGLFSAGIDYKGIDMTNPIYSDLSGKLKAQKEAGYKLYWIGDGNEDPWLSGVKDHMKLMDGRHEIHLLPYHTRTYLGQLAPVPFTIRSKTLSIVCSNKSFPKY